MIIGLTGTKASGKGIVADMLKEKGFIYLSLSDAVRDEAKARGLVNYSVSQLQDIGNDLRKTYGNGILAKRILQKIEIESNKENNNNFVIDGIRNPGESEELRKFKGKEFILIAVDAPLKERFERLLARGRDSDPKTWQDFLTMDERDRGIDNRVGKGGKAEENSGQQVEKCIAMANIKIYNGSSIDALKNKVQIILKNLNIN